MHIQHHKRFAAAVIAGLVAFALGYRLDIALRILFAGDAFFVAYLGLMAAFAHGITPDRLRARAAAADEGVALILLLSGLVVVMAFCAIFLVLNSPGMNAPPHALLAVASVILGWFMVHTMAAFHYAMLYYGPQDTTAGITAGSGLQFPGTSTPGLWEFLYFALVIGVAAQVSDVAVNSTRMRRAVLIHSVAAFFYNAVLLALTVNAALTFASGPTAAG